MSKRPFLIEGDPAKEVVTRWERWGIVCELDTEETGIVVRNYSWSAEGEQSPPVPVEAQDELGEHYDAILSHLRYWQETRAIVERIYQRHGILSGLSDGVDKK